MIIVEIKGKTSLDSALKTLKNKFIKSKTVKDLNERKTFTKRSDKRRAKIRKAKYIESLRANKNSD